jgi:hypothetical protein
LANESDAYLLTVGNHLKILYIEKFNFFLSELKVWSRDQVGSSDEKYQRSKISKVYLSTPFQACSCLNFLFPSTSGKREESEKNPSSPASHSCAGTKGETICHLSGHIEVFPRGKLGDIGGK